MLTHICNELTLFRKDMAYRAALLSRGDKSAFFFAIVMFIGSLFPWITTNGIILEPFAHFFLALATLYQTKNVICCQTELTSPETIMRLKLRRISFHYLIIGLISMFFSLVTLVYFCYQAGSNSPENAIGLSCYLTIFSGVAIFFCGLERFIR